MLHPYYQAAVDQLFEFSLGFENTRYNRCSKCSNLTTLLYRTANCIIIDHLSAFEPGLVAPFLYCVIKTAGFEPKRPDI